MKISPYVIPGIRRNDLPIKSKIQKRSVITPDYVLRIVSESCNVTVEQILSKSRTTEISEARHIFCAIMKLELNYTYESIGQLTNKRDHSTAIHSVRTFKNRCETEEGYKEHSEMIINKLYSSI